MLSNPGGLWGITVDRLGKVGVTSARNGHLLRICQNVRSREGNRVVEALASGIPAVLNSLRAAGMVPPRFHDQGISFTVAVPNHALLASEDLQWLAAVQTAAPLSDRQRHALVAMRHSYTWTNQSFRDTFPMDSREARQELAGLVDAGVAIAEGERRGRVYRLADHLMIEASAGSVGTPGSDHPAAPEDTLRFSTTSRRAGARAANATRIAEALEAGAKTLAQLITETGLTARQVKYAVQEMRSAGIVILSGKRGQRDSRYELRP